MLPQSFYLLLPFASLGMGAIITEYVTVKTMTYVNAPAAPTIQAAAQPPAIVHGSLNPLDSHTSNNALADAVLISVNMFRKQHNASPLLWNDTLASYAANHVSGCVFQHTKGPYGENLAAGTDQNVEAAVDSWGNERASYGFANGGFSMGTGHFTQLVWKDTTSVGCGRVYCNRPETPGWFLMCEFYPAVSYSLSKNDCSPQPRFLGWGMLITNRLRLSADKRHLGECHRIVRAECAEQGSLTVSSRKGTGRLTACRH